MMKRPTLVVAIAFSVALPAEGQERIVNSSPSPLDRWEILVTAATEPVWVECNGRRLQPKAFFADKALFDLNACLKRGANRISVTVDGAKGHTMANHEIRKNGAVALTDKGSARIECGPNTGRLPLCDNVVLDPNKLRKHDYDLDM